MFLKGITNADVKILDTPNYENISKLAIQFSDAIIQGSNTLHPEVKKFMMASGKQFLGYQSKEAYIEAYNDFYSKM